MGKYFGTDGFRGEANVKTYSRSCISRGTLSWLVLRQRSQGEDRDRQGYKKKQLHV